MSFRKEMKKLFVSLGIASFCVIVGLWVFAFATKSRINDEGSPALAANWKKILEPLDDPESASRVTPSIHHLRFKSGEWVIWMCQDSHETNWSPPGGGTLVLRDNRGSTRTFFGHVCGNNFIEAWFSGVPSLDKFYEHLKDMHFVEHDL